MNVLYRSTPLDITDESGRELVIRASRAGVLDEVGTVIMPGAYGPALDAFVRDGHLLYNHDGAREPVGLILQASEQDLDLVVRARLYDTDDAERLRRKLIERGRQGRGWGASIGFSATPKWFASGRELLEWAKESGYDVDRLDPALAEAGRVGAFATIDQIYEVSLVLYPANRDAQLLELRGLRLDEHIDAVVGAADRLIDRLREVAELRAAKNRSISPTTRARGLALARRLRVLARATEREEVEALLARLTTLIGEHEHEH